VKYDTVCRIQANNKWAISTTDMNIPCLHVHHRVLYLCPVISSHPDGSSPFSHTSIPYYLGRLERLHVIQRLGGTSIHVGLIVKKLIQAPARPGSEDYSAPLLA